MTMLPLDRPLAALLRAIAKTAAAPFLIQTAVSTAWASATFTGGRHCVTLLLEGADAGARAAVLRATLEEMDFTLPGHIVADIAVAPGEGTALSFDVLTIEDS